MGKFFDMALLWLVHFLQTTEGQAILLQAENELTADIEADALETSGTDAGGQGGTPPVTPPVPPATQASFINPKKRSSATNEQA